MEWLWLALVSALSLASADALTKARLSRWPTGEVALVRFAVTGALLVPWLAVTAPARPPAAFWGWVLAAVPLELAAMWLYMRAIQRSPLALTLPFLAFTPIFAALTGWLLLGEAVSPLGLVGVTLAVAGAWVLHGSAASGHSGWRRWLAPFAAVLREPGSRLMLAVALIYSLTSVLGKGALRYMAPVPFGALYYALLGVIAGLGLLALRARPGMQREAGSRAPVPRAPAVVVVIGALMAAMVVSHFTAIAQVEVAYMITVKRCSLLFGILYGAWLFGERGLMRHLLGGVLMLAGVAFVTVAA